MIYYKRVGVNFFEYFNLDYVMKQLVGNKRKSYNVVIAPERNEIFLG